MGRKKKTNYNSGLETKMTVLETYASESRQVVLSLLLLMNLLLQSVENGYKKSQGLD